MTMMHGHTSKDPIMQNLQHMYIHQQQCKSTPPFTLINSTTIALSSIYVHTINQAIIQLRVITILSTNIKINCHISINQHQLYNIAQQLHTLSHNPSKGENTTPYDKHHIQHLTIIHISSCNHIKLSTKICQVFGLKDCFRQGSFLILQLYKN